MIEAHIPEQETYYVVAIHEVKTFRGRADELVHEEIWTTQEPIYCLCPTSPIHERTNNCAPASSLSL